MTILSSQVKPVTTINYNIKSFYVRSKEDNIQPIMETVNRMTSKLWYN